MVDITKCMNDDCPQRQTCYRYLAKPIPKWQSYAAFMADKDGKCRDYIEWGAA